MTSRLNQCFVQSQPGFLHPASSFDMDKVKSTLKQIVRDWSDDGAPERAASYQPVLDEITLQFPPDKWSVEN